MNLTDIPTISFVVASLNEETTIEPCVRSLLNQRYPAGLIQVAVVDGGSTDRTREIVTGLAREDSRVRLLDNPARTAPHAFNIGIAGTTGALVSLQSAHGTADADYATVLVASFNNTDAALVGGRVVTAPADRPTPMSEAIARAMSSPLGVGSARFRHSDRPGWVDTAYPGAYRRELFDRIGGFDESLVRNQDDELHLRARRAGYPMWFEPRLRSTYRPRQRLPQLWNQYSQYGWWRSATLIKHRQVTSLRHIVPAALVAGLTGAPIVAATLPDRRHRRLLRLLWSGGAGAWLAVLVTAGVRERGASPRVALRVPAAVACLHIAYGVGFWRGLPHWIRRRKVYAGASHPRGTS
jgi:GT2 family glycosyltransferase